MAGKVTDAERERITQLCNQGLTCNAIATELGRSPDTISRIARDIGHTFGHTNAARAREARSGYCAERRAVAAGQALGQALKILGAFDAEQSVVVPGVGVASSKLDARGQRDRATAVQTLMRVVTDVARLDEKADTSGQAKGLLEELVESARVIAEAG